MQPIVNQFYGYLKQDKIMGLKCQRCEAVLFPPRGICPKCGSNDLAWIEISGRGKLLLATLGEHRRMGIPFVQGTVKLEEGPLVFGMIIIDGFDLSKPEKIWEYNLANIDVTAEVIKNPEGAEAVAFRVSG